MNRQDEKKNQIKRVQDYCDHLSTCFLTMGGRFVDALHKAKDMDVLCYNELMSNPTVRNMMNHLTEELDLHHSELKHLFDNDTLGPYHDYKTRIKREMKEIAKVIRLINETTTHWNVTTMRGRRNTRMVWMVLGVVVAVLVFLMIVK